MSSTRAAPVSPGPLHARLAETLAARIHEGHWAVGVTLPPEVTLCAEFGVSRQTMRHAMMALSERGLIVRRRGAGTRVIARQRSRRFTQTVNSMDEILRYPKNTYRENVVTEIVEVQGDLQALMKASPGSSWFHIGAARRELDSDLPVAWTDIYIQPRYADVVKRRDHARTMVYEQIEAAHGVAIDRAEVEIFPERISAPHARRLKVDAGSPALAIVRRYYDAEGELFEVSVTRHAEKRFVYAMEFRRSTRG
jgi:DNA-binding GntR family transcriptional regulator